MPAHGLFSHSGGLAWHAKAWFRHERLWADFSGRIALFLKEWLTHLPPSPGLIICGPSGGWCLPKTGFLDRFDHLVMVDPDPLAPRFFNRRHPGNRSHPDARTWIHSTFEPVLPELLNRHPQHAVLFCNVLGQLRVHDNRPLERIEFELSQLKTTLYGRHWASFHDRISGEVAHTALKEREFFSPGPVQNITLAKRVADRGEWLDHLTENVLPTNVGRRLIGWPIRPTRLHWVEAGWVGAQESSAGSGAETDTGPQDKQQQTSRQESSTWKQIF